MSVGRICQREVDVAFATEDVRTAAQRMLQRKVGSLVVVDKEMHPLGIVTDRDIAVRVVASAMNAIETNVKDIMTPHPEVVSEETPIEDALALMRGHGFRRVIVVGTGGRLAGVVTLDDILRLLSDEFAMVGQLLTKQAPKSVGEELEEGLGRKR